jgi:hypothetical protein
MAFLKTARAVVVHPSVNPTTWSGLRKTASVTPAKSVSAQAHEILGGPLDPARYLVSHCTIVASVDVKPVPGVKTGKIKVGSKTLDRRWPEYFVTANTDQFINNNHDAFPRDVLLKSYRTFVGAQNYLEHVQIEEQSKGRIIDAVARDIGDSIYVDILVATDRKHASLVQQIENGTLTTLSMGCICDATQCTKCGNVGVDETQLCDCVKYEKGNYFLDEQGNRRRVAEICGHKSMNETGGVRFIEASWVAVPAFPGAVMRNILNPMDAIGAKAQEVLSSPPPQWDSVGTKKAASVHHAFDLGDVGGGDEGGGDAAAAPAEEKDPLEEAEEKLYTALRDRVVKRVEDSLAKKNQTSQALPPAEGGSASTNENVMKMAASRLNYVNAMNRLVRTASSQADLVSGIVTVNSLFGVKLRNDVYWAAYHVGSMNKYASSQSFLAACRKKAGRNLTTAEVRAIIRIGSLLARRARISAGE